MFVSGPGPIERLQYITTVSMYNPHHFVAFDVGYLLDPAGLWMP